MLVGIFGMWLCAVPLSYLFGNYWGWGLVGIWIAMALMRFYEVYCLSIAGIAENGKKNVLLRCSGIVCLRFYIGDIGTLVKVGLYE